MCLLTEEQREEIREAIYKNYGTCYNCMPWEKGPVWIVPSADLNEVILSALAVLGIETFDGMEAHECLDELVEELELACPNCGTAWNDPWIEIGEHFEDETFGRSIKIRIPRINDDSHGFEALFQIWNETNDERLDVTFDFSRCDFLRPNAVAFIGGLARLIKARLGRVTFDWSSCNPKVLKNLQKNGFTRAFGHEGYPWPGGTIFFREDMKLDPNGIGDYIQNQWLDRGWVNVSERLASAIESNMWEIYANAFEHSGTPVGVFSCGQYFPNLKILNLTIVDFGIGIPPKVRLADRKDPRMALRSGGACLHWAFLPGNSTSDKTELGRGIGLDILRAFVIKNKGRLEVFSHDGYALFSTETERYETRRTYFEGTLFNISLRCDEKEYYCLSDEIASEPLF